MAVYLNEVPGTVAPPGHVVKGVQVLTRSNGITPVDSAPAIETRYNGYRFRSRLEARWAVFFDAAYVRYEYEVEGFVLEGGLRYLPDFWLPDFECWYEVKPGRLTSDWWSSVEGLKVLGLAKQNNQSIVVSFGVPADDCECVFVRGGDAESYATRWTVVLYGGLIRTMLMFPNNDICEAVEKARGARFEFGERGG